MRPDLTKAPDANESDQRIELEQALKMLPDATLIGVMHQPTGGRPTPSVWDRQRLIELLRTAPSIEICGPHAQSLGFNLVAPFANGHIFISHTPSKPAPRPVPWKTLIDLIVSPLASNNLFSSEPDTKWHLPREERVVTKEQIQTACLLGLFQGMNGLAGHVQKLTAGSATDAKAIAASNQSIADGFVHNNNNLVAVEERLTQVHNLLAKIYNHFVPLKPKPKSKRKKKIVVTFRLPPKGTVRSKPTEKPKPATAAKPKAKRRR